MLKITDDYFSCGKSFSNFSKTLPLEEVLSESEYFQQESLYNIPSDLGLLEYEFSEEESILK